MFVSKCEEDVLLPSFLQVVLLSATMPAEVLDVTTKFMREPVRILVKKEELTLEGIRQFYINVEKEVHCSQLIWGYFYEKQQPQECMNYFVKTRMY